MYQQVSSSRSIANGSRVSLNIFLAVDSEVEGMSEIHHGSLACQCILDNNTGNWPKCFNYMSLVDQFG